MPNSPSAEPSARRTAVSLRGEQFLLNGRPTYEGRAWNGRRIEGLLLNSRMVQATFDDLNPETVAQFAYPDAGKWDPDRNIAEFVAALPTYRRHGLLAVTLNLQGGSPYGYSKQQPWHNSAFAADGSLRPASLARMEKALDAADRLGMAVFLGLFYFGQDQRLADEAAVVRGVDAAVDWLFAKGYANVIVEINNECDVPAYDHAILKPARVAELIERVRRREVRGRRLLAGTSFGGGKLPAPAVVQASDVLFLHGNGVREPAKLADLVRRTRALAGAARKPIVVNEDDHFDFDKPANNFAAALGEGASWGYFDYRMKGEGPAEGFQSVPVDWTISSARKRGFFKMLAEVTGSPPP